MTNPDAAEHSVCRDNDALPADPVLGHYMKPQKTQMRQQLLQVT